MGLKLISFGFLLVLLITGKQESIHIHSKKVSFGIFFHLNQDSFLRFFVVVTLRILKRYVFSGTDSLNCHKCYRLEACPVQNCSDIYGFVNTVYRQHYFIGNDKGLPICPVENDELAWKKLEIDGWCGADSVRLKNQPCSISRFEMAGPALKDNKINGVFLGCSKPFLLKGLTNKYDCVKFHRRFERYREGIRDPRNKFVDLLLKLEQCRNNCSKDSTKCDVCFEDGCIHPSNTQIKPGFIHSKALPISFALLGLALFLSVSAILAYFCGGERQGRLDIIQAEDGSIFETLINKKPNK